MTQNKNIPNYKQTYQTRARRAALPTDRPTCQATRRPTHLNDPSDPNPPTYRSIHTDLEIKKKSIVKLDCLYLRIYLGKRQFKVLD